MTDNLVKKLLVKTEYKAADMSREYGTGILICTNSDEYDYVFTSLHCIEGKKGKNDGSFMLFSKTYGELKYIQEDVYKDPKLDIAIIKIKKVLSNIVIYHQDHELQKEGIFIGYPEIYTDKYEEVDARIHFCQKDRIQVDDGQFNYGRERVIEVFGGFSGSPVFLIKKNYNFLSGIIIELSDPKFITQQLNFVPIREFLTAIKIKGWKSINTYDLSIMESCVDKTFKSDEAEEIYNILCRYSKKFKKLNINYYIEWLNEKMFLPYGKYPMFEESVWIGWIKYLTFMYLISKDEFYDSQNNKFDEIKFLQYIKNCRKEGVKYFHSYECKTFQDLVPILYENTEVYKDLKYGDAVIANFGTLYPKTNYIPNGELANIVKNIGNGGLDDRLINSGIDITFPEVNKALDILHISYFEDYLCKNWNFCTNTRILEAFIKTSIQEVINNVKGAS